VDSGEEAVAIGPRVVVGYLYKGRVVSGGGHTRVGRV